MAVVARGKGRKILPPGYGFWMLYVPILRRYIRIMEMTGPDKSLLSTVKRLDPEHVLLYILAFAETSREKKHVGRIGWHQIRWRRWIIQTIDQILR